MDLEKERVGREREWRERRSKRESVREMRNMGREKE